MVQVYNPNNFSVTLRDGRRDSVDVQPGVSEIDDAFIPCLPYQRVTKYGSQTTTTVAAEKPAVKQTPDPAFTPHTIVPSKKSGSK